MDCIVHSRLFTQLLLAREGRRANDHVLFGRPIDTKLLNEKSTIHCLGIGQIFGFVRWRGDQYGTQTWRVVVAQAGRPGERLTSIPGVNPGAHLLLHAVGKTRAKRALRVIDMLSEAHVLHEIAPVYWRHVHVQISKNEAPEPYEPKVFEALSRARSIS